MGKRTEGEREREKTDVDHNDFFPISCLVLWINSFFYNVSGEKWMKLVVSFTSSSSSASFRKTSTMLNDRICRLFQIDLCRFFNESVNMRLFSFLLFLFNLLELISIQRKTNVLGWWLTLRSSIITLVSTCLILSFWSANVLLHVFLFFISSYFHFIAQTQTVSRYDLSALSRIDNFQHQWRIKQISTKNQRMRTLILLVNAFFSFDKKKKSGRRRISIC